MSLIPKINKSETLKVVERINNILSTQDEYSAAKDITKNYIGSFKLTDKQALIGFWVPGLVDGFLADKKDGIKLEIYLEQEKLTGSDIKKNNYKTCKFKRYSLPMFFAGDYAVIAVDDILFGTKEEFGAFYWLTLDINGKKEIMRDPLCPSLPFGVYAPGELYDVSSVYKDRKDMDYFTTFYKKQFADGSYRAKDIGICLEVHTETATEEGTIAALTRRYKAIAEKIQINIDADKEDMYEGLSKSDLNFIGYDTIELTPEVPTSEREAVKHKTGEFFLLEDEDDDEFDVQLKRPDISNWGYDTPVLGSVAISPSILETLRPDELVEFIETIHTMPDKPIQLAIDSVLGHCDFQGAKLLETFDIESKERENVKYINSKYLTGPNMYGRDIDFSNSNVKAVLLELLRRKINLGFDCIRIDGAQDFVKSIDELTGFRIQDDEFLQELVSIRQNINGIERRLDMNLEDGRAWPDDMNWEFNSKYMDHCIQMTLDDGERVKQWSPIIFAHNVHGKFKWFMEKWERFVEVYRYGQSWITGHSNHDNARYFYKMVTTKPSIEYVPNTPFSDYYNDQLGDTLKEVVHNAMDNNALTALMLGFMPGNPLFLLNALFHTPWMFLRNIDDTYDVQILAEEGVKFFEWYVDKALYEKDGNFPRVKTYGLEKYEQLINIESDENGFLEVLYDLFTRIKSDPVAVRYLYEDTADEGNFETVDELEETLFKIHSDKEYKDKLIFRIEDDKLDSDRRILSAKKLLISSRKILVRELSKKEKLESIGKLKNPQDIVTLKSQINKIDYLQNLSNADLVLLLEHSKLIDEYDLDLWAASSELYAVSPESLKDGDILDRTKLKKFANDFMLDARDAAKVHKYEEELDEARVKYNFSLRQYRLANPWLLYNPGSDVQKDYFAKKFYVNGAKVTGDWRDRGDIVNCNTIYYGWRTNPEDASKKVFLIANMEGEAIEELPLDIFLNEEGKWRVITKSPSLKEVPELIDRYFKVKDFKNGEAILVEKV